MKILLIVLLLVSSTAFAGTITWVSPLDGKVHSMHWPSDVNLAGDPDVVTETDVRNNGSTKTTRTDSNGNFTTTDPIGRRTSAGSYDSSSGNGFVYDYERGGVKAYIGGMPLQ